MAKKKKPNKSVKPRTAKPKNSKPENIDPKAIKDKSLLEKAGTVISIGSNLMNIIHKLPGLWTFLKHLFSFN